MPQRKSLMSDLSIRYEGLFDAPDLFRIVEDWFKTHGYEKIEIRHAERVREKGKSIDLELTPTKKITDHIKNEINIRVMVNNMTEVKLKKDNKELKINKGSVSIVLNAYLNSDITEEDESKPMWFFLSVLFDKFVHRQYTDKIEKDLLRDVQDLHSELKSYLNLNKYTTGA